MSNKGLIYIVDDEQDICALIAAELNSFGFSTRTFHSAQQILTAIKDSTPDICVVDLGLPDMDGTALVRQLSDTTDAGILILSGRGGLPDRILGLELGADDYLTKPFEPRELTARIHSLLRRLNKHSEPASQEAPTVARFANWQFNSATLGLTSPDGSHEDLSTAEGRLLMTLLQAPQQIVSRERLLGDQDIAYDRSIDSRMSRLRKKLGDDPKKPKLIKTVYGSGYMLAADVHWQHEQHKA